MPESVCAATYSTGSVGLDRRQVAKKMPLMGRRDMTLMVSFLLMSSISSTTYRENKLMFSVTVILSDPELNACTILPKCFERSIECGRVERSFFLSERTEGIDLSTMSRPNGPNPAVSPASDGPGLRFEMTASFCP
jgi:hypothetical protein